MKRFSIYILTVLSILVVGQSYAQDIKSDFENHAAKYSDSSRFKLKLEYKQKINGVKDSSVKVDIWQDGAERLWVNQPSSEIMKDTSYFVYVDHKNKKVYVSKSRRYLFSMFVSLDSTSSLVQNLKIKEITTNKGLKTYQLSSLEDNSETWKITVDTINQGITRLLSVEKNEDKGGIEKEKTEIKVVSSKTNPNFGSNDFKTSKYFKVKTNKGLTTYLLKSKYKDYSLKLLFTI